MNFAQVCQGINNAIRCLSEYTQVRNVVVQEQDRVVSWGGRRPGILKGVYYPLEYQSLLDNQDYSLLLADGSFFQFYYAFDAQGDLEKARLAYYPRPLETLDSIEEMYDAAEGAIEREDAELYEHLYNWTELIDIKGVNPSNTSHIRFDYDRGNEAHSDSHIQFSGINNLRVDASFFPQPMAFIKFCESLIMDGNVLGDAEGYGFERNNCLQLDHPGGLITLTHIS